jgi:shikimate kinase
MGSPFHDTDEMVELSAGKSIARIFSEDGEPAFRVLESAAVAALARRARAGERFVAATGGGIVTSAANVALIRASGLVVWLSAPAGVLRERIGSDPASAARRPALRGASSRDEVEALLAEREPLYRAAAHEEVAVAGLSVEEAAGRILQASAGFQSAPGG